MAGCAGCGLRANPATLGWEIATSEEWLAGALAGFGIVDTVGGPVYCDGAGELRAAPEHTSVVVEARADQSVVNLDNTTFFATLPASAAGAATSLTVNNPSSTRPASVLALFAAIVQIDGFTSNQFSWVPLLDVDEDAADLFELTGTFLYAPVGLLEGTKPFRDFWHVSDSAVKSIAAGGSVTYDAAVSVELPDVDPGWFQGAAFTSAVSIRAMVRTAAS